LERRSITIRGIVQGVGFRPFVYHLAVRLHLRGFVKNQAGSVLIEVEGETPTLERFLTEIVGQPPPLAQIEHVSWEARDLKGESHLCIEPSDSASSDPVFFSPDIATCPECLAELENPSDRHFGYPFLNCTNCGPRLTIIAGAPYDRRQTTMAAFTKRSR
jgi:hydrogenase maturation protein HypF